MSNYSIILNGCINQFKTNNEILGPESEIFELFGLTQITKQLDLTFEDIENSIVDGGNDGGIDSLLILIDDTSQQSLEDLEEIKFTNKTQLTIIISQCKKEKSFKELAIDRLITTIPELFNLERSEDALLMRFNANLVEKALIAREAWKKCTISGGRLQLIFNYSSFSETIEINGAFQAKINQLIALTRTIFIGSEIHYNNYSCQELLKLYQKQRNNRLSLIFKDSPLSTG
jgi:hypothetical protein